MNKLFEAAKGGGNFLKTLTAVLLFSKLNFSLGRLKKMGPKGQCIILGNGPSLKKTMPKILKFLENRKTFCFNDFAASPYFMKVKPTYYALMDSIFWAKNTSAELRKDHKEYFETMRDKVDWDMTVFFPVRARRENYFAGLARLNPHIKIVYVNTTELYSSDRINFFFYRNNLAMPPMQNVLVASIFISLNLGFKKIYLLGADHSWHKTICISDKNILCLEDNRLQDKDKKKPSPFLEELNKKIPYKMCNLFRDLSKMFFSYMELERYAQRLGAKIYNATEGSYIDAFERKKLKVKGEK